MSLPSELKNKGKKKRKFPRVPLPKKRGGPFMVKVRKKDRYRIDYRRSGDESGTD